MKKSVLILVAVLMLLLCATAPAALGAQEMNGSCGESLTWTLQDDTLTISGTGAMADYARDQAPWATQPVKKVIVEEGVTSISENAFRFNSELEEAVLPSSLQTIGAGAFRQCFSLKTVTLKEGLRSIGAQAFHQCSKLQAITLPQSLEDLGKEAFNACELLPAATLGPKLKTVPAAAFSGCAALKTVVFSEGLTAIESDAFFRCGALETVALPQSLETIGSGAFTETGLKDLTLPAKVTQLGSNAFASCKALETITLPDGLETIGSGAFMNCALLKEALLPNSVTSLGVSAFSLCTALTTVTLPQTLKTLPEGIFSGCKALKTLALPDGLTAIGGNSFSGCAALETIEIPATVTAIGTAAFSGCKALKTLPLPAGLTSLGTAVFRDCETLQRMEIPAGVPALEDELFSGCKALGQVTLPAGATRIGSKAFAHCEALAEITLPQSLQTIGEEAFAYCYALKALDVPQGVTKIPARMCQNCTTLAAITLPDGLTAIGKMAFLETAYLNNEANKTGGCVYCGSYLLQGALDQKDCTIREGTTVIADNALTATDKVETLVLPASLTSFGDNDFSACTALKTVTYSGTETQWHTLTLPQTPENVVLPTETTQAPLRVADVVCKTADGGTVTLTAVLIPEVPSTCARQGTHNGRQCSSCGKTVLRPQLLPAVAHNFVFNQSYGATCSKKGKIGYVCSVCGAENYKFDVLAPDVHVNTVEKPAIAATCAAYGYSAGVYCNDCRKYISGHKQQPFVPHSYQVSVQPATLKSGGTRTSVCTVCGTKTQDVFAGIGKITLKQTSFVYNGKKQTPAVTVLDKTGKALKKNRDYTVKYDAGRKKIGAYQVVVTFKGDYAGSKTLKFKIVPPAVESFKAKSGTGKATLSWAKGKGADTYVVYYAAAKNGKYKKLVSTAKCAYTVTKLPKGTYYFKVVAVRKLDSGNFKSAPSVIRKAKIK